MLLLQLFGRKLNSFFLNQFVKNNDIKLHFVPPIHMEKIAFQRLVTIIGNNLSLK